MNYTVIKFILCGVFLGSLSVFATRLPPNTQPMYVPDPVLPSDPSTPQGFGCYGACGPSCDCVGRTDTTTTTCEEGMRCEWKVISCKTHSFCRWHDSCYLACDNQFPGKVNDHETRRSSCYRRCDFACINGVAPEAPGGWTVTPPGPPPEALGMVKCIERLSFSDKVPYDGVTAYAGEPKCVADPNCP